MRLTLQVACIAALLGVSSIASAAMPPRHVPAPHFPRGPWHCQTPPGSETLLPVECGCQNHPLSQAQQKEYDRLSQVAPGTATRYDQSRIFKLNREIRAPRWCIPDEPPHIPGPFGPPMSAQQTLTRHLPPPPPPAPGPRNPPHTKYPPRPDNLQTAPAEVGDNHAPALPVLTTPHPVLKRSIITPPPRLPPAPPSPGPRNPPRTKYLPIPNV